MYAKFYTRDCDNFYFLFLLEISTRFYQIYRYFRENTSPLLLGYSTNYSYSKRFWFLDNLKHINKQINKNI